MNDQAPRVSFAVWDEDTSSPLVPLQFATIKDGTGELVAVGVTRGVDPGYGPAMQVWSFSPRVTHEYPRWPLEHAAMAFVAPLAKAEGVRHREAVVRITAGLEGGEPASLVVDGETVGAVLFTLYRDWRVAASADPQVPVAVLSSGRELPTVLRVIRDAG